jgi:hypothetical protein
VLIGIVMDDPGLRKAARVLDLGLIKEQGQFTSDTDSGPGRLAIGKATVESSYSKIVGKQS